MLAVNMDTAKRAERILLLVTQADWGGVQSFLIRFATELMKEGRTVLLAAGGDGELWDAAQRHGIPTRRLEHVRREIDLLEDARAVTEIEALIREFHPDAIHLNSSKMGVLGAIAADRLPQADRPRVVYRIGGWAFLEPLPAWKRWVYRTAERWSASKKDVIITVHPGDETIARDLKIRPREKVMTVANGLDLPEFTSRLATHAVARETLNLPEHAFVYGTIANAYATKGLLPYLATLHKVLQEDQNAYAVIIGDGPQFAQLKALRAKLDLTDRVLLAGHVDHAGTLLPGFDVFVLPSRKEGMPWTLLEAMGAGIPSIATNVGACAWMITHPDFPHAGLIVPKDDSVALQEAMHQLRVNDAERHALANGARTNVQQRFTWTETLRGNRDALDGRA